LSQPVKKIWRTLGARLSDAGIVNKIDSIAFEMLVRAVVEYEQAETTLAKSGPLLTGERGADYYNPAWAVRNKASKVLLQLLKEFGLTPGSRSAVRVVKPAKSADPAAKYFGG
jgi:P27 family predicted phage terminase small subunit